MTDDDYTIEPFNKFFNDVACCGGGWLQAGDVIDMLTGDRIVGPYCEWPKKERFKQMPTDVVIVGMDIGEADRTVYMEQMMFYNNEPRFIELTRKEFDSKYGQPYEPVLKNKIKSFKKKDWQHRYPWEK